MIGRSRSRTSATLVLGMLALLACSRRSDTPPASWTWHPGPLEEALATARKEGLLLLVQFEATWCPECRQLERDVFARAVDRLPRVAMTGVRVDFDTPAGQTAVQRYRIVGLPTTVVLGPDGVERGRIEGFEGVDAWLAALRSATEGVDDLDTWVERARTAPDDPTVLIELGARRLARGDEEEGLRLLERARSLDPANAAGAYSDATRRLGRYHARVRRDFDAALAIFREGERVLGEGRAAWGFRYWIAMMLRQSDRHDEAIAYLDGLIAAHPRLPEPATLKADFLYMNGLADEEALALARKATELEPTDPDVHYLLGAIAERLGRRAEALEAARRAVTLDASKQAAEGSTDTAIYRELLERLEAGATEP